MRSIKHGGKVFRDPIHRLIRIECGDEVILDLIDTPEFQRLRRIRQLGVSCLTFHGAEHTRFVHSLGVFNFAQRILQTLRSRYADHKIAEYLKIHDHTVKVAALVHDIGHGPFSHMIERAFKGNFKHEQRTVEIIRNPDSEVGKVLTEYEIDAEQVARIIDHTSEHQLLTDIVSSQLDADRMDYLLRDSHNTGVQYGLYDSEWILNSLCIGKDRASTDGNPFQSYRLCLDERRGQSAAEQLIIARVHMNEQVYFHRVTRGYETLLLNLFEEAAKQASSQDLPSATPAVVAKFFLQKGNISLEEFLSLDETQMFAAMHAWASVSQPPSCGLSRLSMAFLKRDRIYGSFVIEQPSFGAARLMELYAAMIEKGLREGVDWRLDEIRSAVYKGIVNTASRGRRPEEDESRLESILVATGKPDGVAKPIELSSDLMKSLDQQRRVLTRLYYDQACASTIEPLLMEKFNLKPESAGVKP